MSAIELKHLTQDEAKDLIIAKLLDDLKITEGWIRRHVNDDEDASHHTLTVVADCLRDISAEYTVDRIIDRYMNLFYFYSSARICLSDYESRGRIYPEMLRLAKESLAKLV